MIALEKLQSLETSYGGARVGGRAANLRRIPEKTAMKKLIVGSLLLCLPVLATDKPLLGIPGKLVYENALADRPEGWTAPKGDWKSADGALCGAEKPEDKHGAVIRMNKTLSDFIIQYEVKMDGAKGTSLSINDPKGHLARVSVAPTSVRVTKDDHDHEGPDQAVVFGALKADVKPGTWHTVRMEIVGQEILGKVDDVVAFGSHEQLSTAKSNIGLTVAGQTASFRNLKIWEATLNPDWAIVRTSLPKGEPLPPPRAPVKKSEPKK